MKVYGNLDRAAFEVKASDYATAITGLVWFNTAATQVKVHDGTNIRALLRNDGFAVLGNSGTASQNIRFHRGAAGVLQFVSGADVTAEGSLSTSLNQISGRLENYTTGARPAAGNAGRTIWNTSTSTLQVDTGAAFQEVAPANIVAPYDAQNYGLTASVAASALTIAVKTVAGTDASASDVIKVTFRSATSATGTATQRTITGALSAVVSSGSTLGHVSAQNEFIYVYLLDNAGTLELAYAGNRIFDEGSVQTTTAEGGAGAADSKTTLYSTTARSNVPVRFIGRLKSNQAAAGTWATAISEISLQPSNKYKAQRSEVWLNTGNGHGSTNTVIRRFTNNPTATGTAMTYADSAGNGMSITVNEEGLYAISYSDVANGAATIIGISVNSAQLTTGIMTITAANRLQAGGCENAGVGGDTTIVANVSVTTELHPGDVVRAHTNGSPNGTGAGIKFVMTKISD